MIERKKQWARKFGQRQTKTLELVVSSFLPPETLELWILPNLSMHPQDYRYLLVHECGFLFVVLLFWALYCYCYCYCCFGGLFINLLIYYCHYCHWKHFVAKEFRECHDWTWRDWATDRQERVWVAQTPKTFFITLLSITNPLPWLAQSPLISLLFSEGEKKESMLGD
jgi:hypothetical protein